MPRLDADTYLAHLRSESSRFRDVLTGLDPLTRVPTCPDWTADDLAFHLTEVHHFWTWVFTHRPDEPTDEHYSEPERADSFDAQLEAFDRQSAALADALAGADPADEAWSWSADHTVGFTYRRQALEALVHRFDADLTAGKPIGPTDAALAADGVAEVLGVMYGGDVPAWGELGLLPHYIKVEITDADEVLWVQLGHFSGTDPDGIDHEEDAIDLVPDPGVEPDAVITGEALPLLARLWRRGDGAAIHVAGDLLMIDRFRSATHEPLT